MRRPSIKNGPDPNLAADPSGGAGKPAALLRAAFRSMQKKPLAAAFLLGVIGYCIFAQIFTGTICLIHSVTGMPCPTCGITRAAASLLSGNFAGAFAIFPLWPAAAILLAAAFLHLFVLRGRSRTVMVLLMLPCGAAIFVRYIWGMAVLFPHTAPYVLNARALLPRLLELFR